MSGSLPLTLALLSVVISPSGAVGSLSNLKCNATADNGMKLHVFSGHIIRNTTVELSDEYKTKHRFIGNENECVERCVELVGCTAILVGGVDEPCYHFYGDIYSLKLKKPHVNKILVLGSGACRRQPCENGGECVPDYANMDYTCRCEYGFHGSHCEEEIVTHLPNLKLHYSFDDGNKNIGSTWPSFFSLSLGDGNVREPPDRRGKVVYVNEVE